MNVAGLLLLISIAGVLYYFIVPKTSPIALSKVFPMPNYGESSGGGGGIISSSNSGGVLNISGGGFVNMGT